MAPRARARSSRGSVAALVGACLLAAGSFAAAQENGLPSSIGRQMELQGPFWAITPAHAAAPSSGVGPVITSVTRNPFPQPLEGQDIPIEATIGAAASSVTLTYLVNYGPEQSLPMTAGANGRFTAAIPSKAFNKTNMVRWYVTAIGVNQQTSRSPPADHGERYFGTVITDPSVQYKIPILEWFTDDVTGSSSKVGANGSSVYFLGRFYDNIHVRRKGVTSLSWPKPKLKFKLAASSFVYKPQLNKTAKEKKIQTFDLNSLYYEPGTKSYMREAIAYQVLQDSGAVAAINFHIIVNLNGAFYGLHTYTENDDSQYLERNGLSKKGVLIKPTSGSDGNLGYSVAVDQLQYSYKQQNHKTHNYWPYLHAFTQGIAGAGNVTRSKFVFDYVELSETINTMAVLTMLLTQDRCTKNYLLYLNLNTSQWQMFAYDLKSALNADAGYPNGKPAADYCTLECPQWNSPLYCDRNHPQDVATDSTSPWTFISASSIGRRLLQDAPAPVPDSGPHGINANITAPDENLVAKGNVITGPAGTFNYLIDLITQVPATRQMYMRRLRTLTDKYYTSGKLIQMVKDMYTLIHEAADADDKKWHIGNITNGFLQLTEDQIPTRQKQLLELYGPMSQQPLLPAPQPADASLAFGKVDSVSVAEQQFIQLVNPNMYAVDISNWRIEGSVNVDIKPGTVVAAGNSLLIAKDPAGFRQRTVPPTIGQGFQVTGPINGSLVLGGGLKLVNEQGTVVASQAAPATQTAG